MRQRQLELDYHRGQQLALLRDCVLTGELAGHDGRGVSAAVAKSVLRMIDDFGRGRTAFVGLEKLREVTGLRSVRTVIRATQALESLGLLIIEKDGRRRCNRYTIVWSELALKCPATPLRPESEGRLHQSAQGGDSRGSMCHFAPEQSDTGAEQSDTGAEQSDTGAEQSDTGVTLTDPRSAEEPPPPTPRADSTAPADWGTAAAELHGFGVERVTQTVRTAKERGLTPDGVLDALRTCKANAGRFRRPPAALAVWVRDGDWPAEGVEDWRAAEARRATATAKRQDWQRGCDEAEREAEIARREQQELERRFGRVLDSLGPAELASLEAAQDWSDFQRSAYRRNPRGFCRVDLLRALAGEKHLISVGELVPTV